MKRLYILVLMCLGSITTFGQSGQHIPYPVIFIHGLVGDNTTWDELSNYLQNQYGWSYGGNMNFNLNYDGNDSTSVLEQDVHDFNNPLQAGDFYTVNFDVDVNGNFGTGNNLSNQAAIVKQGLAVSKAIKHVLEITHRDKVILVGHSMGGLAAREYIQNPNLWYEPNVHHHVAKLCTVGTPHGGSNVDLIAVFDWIGGLAFEGIDVTSEAVRDLRTSYFTGKPGVFLFGGKEDKLSMGNPVSGLLFDNADVNCNGFVGDQDTGLNNKILPDLPYSCVLGVFSGTVAGVPLFAISTDGIVSTESANLNHWFANLNADTFMVHNVFHTKLTKEIEAIMRGMDEPGDLRYAYNVNLGDDLWYRGNLTLPPADKKLTIDADCYAVNVPGAGKLSIKLKGLPIDNFVVNVYNTSSTSPIYDTSNHGANTIDVDVPVSSAGKYYVVFRSIPTPATSWESPYSFNLQYTAPPPIINTCYTVLSEPSGTLNDGSGASDYSNNKDCSWLIQPQNASFITLKINSIATEADNDIVYVYDGSDSTYPLLGKFSGTSLPPFIVSSGGSMFVQFITNGSITAAGWDASYNAEIGDTTPIHVPGKISGYKYWYDNDVNNGATISVPERGGIDITTLVQPASMQIGFHTFSLMAKQTDGKWSAPVTSLFYYRKNSEPAIYEYWIDSLYANRKTVTIADTTNFILTNQMLDASAPAKGYHQINIRFKPNGGLWSPVQSHVFYRQTDPALNGIRYWFDSSYASMQTVSVSNTDTLILNNQLLDSADLTNGFHQFNFAVTSAGGTWSPIQSKMFYKQTSSAINGITYWFDDNYTSRQAITVPETSYLVLDNQPLDASSLTNGFHRLSFTVSTVGANTPPAVQSAIFFKRGNDVNAGMDIKKIRYWFNGDFSDVKEMVVSGQNGNINSMIACSGLPDGKNTFNYQLMDNGNVWSSVVVDTFNFINESVTVSGKVFLQGAYNAASSSMNNTLNASGLLSDFALNQPYNNTTFKYEGTEHVDQAFFAAHPDVVDWVLVELRDATTPSKVIASRAAFVKQDGTLMETDGSGVGITFSGVLHGNYYVSVRHRNHLGIRSASFVDFSTGSGSFDFTDAAGKAFQNQSYTSTVQVGSIWAMRSGDANSNGTVKYNGPANDQSQILNNKLSGSLSNIISNTYSPEDINMDGKVRWNGPGNEQNYLLNSLLNGSLVKIYIQQL